MIFFQYAIILLVAFIPFNVYATSILVVDLESVLEHSNSWSIIKKRTNDYASKTHDTILKKQRNIEAIWIKIQRIRNSKAKKPKELVSLERSFQQESQNLQWYKKEKQHSMEVAFLKARKQLLGITQKIILRIAKKRHAQLVINSAVYDDRNVLYFDKILSINKEVLTTLNEEAPTITIDIK